MLLKEATDLSRQDVSVGVVAMEQNVVDEEWQDDFAEPRLNTDDLTQLGIK